MNAVLFWGLSGRPRTPSGTNLIVCVREHVDVTTKKPPCRAAERYVSFHFVSVFYRLVERFLIGVFERAADGQTKGEPCDLNTERFEQF